MSIKKLPKFAPKKNMRQEKRYYLLPGQGNGGRKRRRKQLLAAILAASVFSLGLGLLLWWSNSRH